MTVQELIDELKKMPQNANVEIAVGGEATDSFVVEYFEKYKQVSIYTT